VFQFVPHFLFGMVLGLLVLRTGSVLPAMVFHLVFNCLIIALAVFPEVFQLLGGESAGATMSGLWLPVTLLCAVLALGVLTAVWRLSNWSVPGALEAHQEKASGAAKARW
jgi:Type II CAAX prenyl endopeptidase Rce1-like